MSSTIEQVDNAAVSLFGNGGMPHTRMARPSKFFTRPEKYVLAIAPAAQTPFQRNVQAALDTVLLTAKAILATQHNETAAQVPEQTPSETFGQRPNAYALVLPSKGEFFQRNIKAAGNTILDTAIAMQAEQKAAQIKEEVSTFFSTVPAETASERDAFFNIAKATPAAQQKVLRATSAFFAQSSSSLDDRKGKEEAMKHVGAINIPGVA